MNSENFRMNSTRKLSLMCDFEFRENYRSLIWRMMLKIKNPIIKTGMVVFQSPVAIQRFTE